MDRKKHNLDKEKCRDQPNKDTSILEKSKIRLIKLANEIKQVPIISLKANNYIPTQSEMQQLSSTFGSANCTSPWKTIAYEYFMLFFLFLLLLIIIFVSFTFNFNNYYLYAFVFIFLILILILCFFWVGNKNKETVYCQI